MIGTFGPMGMGGVENNDTKLIKNELLTANRESVKMVLCLHL